MKFQFSLDFFIGAPSTRFHISNLQKSRTEKYMNINRENEQKTINCCGTGKQGRSGFE